MRSAAHTSRESLSAMRWLSRRPRLVSVAADRRRALRTATPLQPTIRRVCAPRSIIGRWC